MTETDSCPVNGLLSNEVCKLSHQHSVDKHTLEPECSPSSTLFL